MEKKPKTAKRGNGKEPKHVHVESGPNQCLSYQVETTSDLFQQALGRASRQASDPKSSRTKSRRKTSHN